MALINNLNAINNCKKDIKTALEGKGVDMTGVEFKDYAAKIEELQLSSGDEPSTPNPSADYIYSNGYVEGGTQDIMTYVPYEITSFDDNNKFIIELFSPVELMGWMDICPDIIFGVDVPIKYTLSDIEIWDNSSNKYIPHGFKKNIRYETIVRDGVTYNSYLRNADGYYESNGVMGDPTAPSYKYKITISK